MITTIIIIMLSFNKIITRVEWFPSLIIIITYFHFYFFNMF